MPHVLSETRRLTEAATVDGGRIRVTIIEPGWGSSGYYSPQILERAAADRVFAAGLHCYVDHPTDREDRERPERSVRDLAAVLTSDASWDGSALVAEALLLPPHAEPLSVPEVADSIGMSIRASAEDVTMGEAEGRRGRIVGRIVEAQSVDFVTRAGRGGRYRLVESAPPSQVVAAAVGHGLSEATANDLREQLAAALSAAYGQGEDAWVYVVDFDDSRVWYEQPGAGPGLYEHTYTVGDDDQVTLTGEPTPVRRVISYVPVTPAGDAPSTTTTMQEGSMPQIEEARLRQLEEAAGRVDALTAERDAARAQLAERDAREGARPRVAALVAESRTLTGRTQARLVEGLVRDLPVDVLGDEQRRGDAVRAAVTEAEAEYPAPGGRLLEGSFGPGGGDTRLSESDVAGAVASAFGRPIKGA